jgi:drug/metabolite transporter (DMT)-like permease
MKTIGIILIIIGVAMIVLKGINFQTQKQVAKVGPIQVNKTENKHVGWPTYTGAVIGIVGVVLLVSGSKNKKA